MCKVDLEDFPNKIDYIYSIRYLDSKAVQNPEKSLQVSDSMIQCNLAQRQRSSQEILDLVDFIRMHIGYQSPLRKYSSSPSFKSETPTWLELANQNSFFDYFQDKFSDCDDVMVIYDSINEPSNLDEITKFCQKKEWKCTVDVDVKGSEASVTILYDYDEFYFEFFTRAKHQLVIVTIENKERLVNQLEKNNF